MSAILRRELSAYFHSPIGYVFLAVFYLFAGYFFSLSNLQSYNADLSFVFAGLFEIILFLVPVLTMRLLSEERRHKTEQLLFTAPVSLTGIVLGKYLSALAVYLAGMAVMPVFALVVNAFTNVGWAAVLCCFLGTLLLGMAMLAVGLFISALTQNQVIAAVGGFAAALFLIQVDVLAGYVDSAFLSSLVVAVSFYRRYQDFSLGVLSLSGVVFFCCVAAVFVFLTVRVLEKRRWS